MVVIKQLSIHTGKDNNLQSRLKNMILVLFTPESHWLPNPPPPPPPLFTVINTHMDKRRISTYCTKGSFNDYASNAPYVYECQRVNLWMNIFFIKCMYQSFYLIVYPFFASPHRPCLRIGEHDILGERQVDPKGNYAFIIIPVPFNTTQNCVVQNTYL